MKKLRSLLILLMWMVTSCQKDTTSEPESTPQTTQENCRVKCITVTGRDALKITYSYDSVGLISCMEIQEVGLSDQRIYFKRNAEGKLISSDWFLGDNTAFSTRERYTYTNDRLTHVDLYDGFDIYYGQRNITYNSSGFITEINFIHDFNDTSIFKWFEYDSEGILTKYLFRNNYDSTDPSIFIEEETITAPQVASVKSSEKYLMDHGLPYEIYKWRPFSITTPGVGSTITTSLNNSTLTYKTVTTNSRGFTEKIEIADSTGNVVQTIIYGFENCK